MCGTLLAAYLGLIFSVIMWGSNFVAGDYLVHYLTPIYIGPTRLIFSSTFLVVSGLILHRFQKLDKKQWTLLLTSGFVGTLLNQYCFYSSVKIISPTESALISSLAPIATSLLSYLFLKEKITKKTIVGSIVAIFGVFLLVSNGEHIRLNIGDGFAAGAMLTLSANMVIVRKLAKDLHPGTITMFGTMIGTALFIPTSIGLDGVPKYPHFAIFWFVLIVSAIISQGVCGLLINNAVSKIGATQVSVVSNLQPFVAMLVGYFALHIPVTHIQIIGGFIIVTGILFATLQLKFKKHTRAIST